MSQPIPNCQICVQHGFSLEPLFHLRGWRANASRQENVQGALRVFFEHSFFVGYVVQRRSFRTCCGRVQQEQAPGKDKTPMTGAVQENGAGIHAAQSACVNLQRRGLYQGKSIQRNTCVAAGRFDNQQNVLASIGNGFGQCAAKRAKTFFPYRRIKHDDLIIAVRERRCLGSCHRRPPFQMECMTRFYRLFRKEAASR